MIGHQRLHPALASFIATSPGPSGPGDVVPGVPGPSRWVLEAIGWAMHRPWLLAVAAGVLVIHALARIALARWRHTRHATGARVVTIAPPPEVEEHAAEALWANLAGTLLPSRRRRWLTGAPHVVWEYLWTGRRLQIRIWVPGTVPPGAVEAAVRAAWPSSAVATEPAGPPLPLDAPAAVGGLLLPTASDRLPFDADQPADPLRALIAAGSQLRPGEQACVQVLARPATPRQTTRARATARRMRQGQTTGLAVNPAAPLLWLVELFLPSAPRRSTTGARPTSAAGRDPGIERDVRAVLDKTAGVLWVTSVRYALTASSARAGTDPHPRLGGLGSTIAAAFAVYDGRNRLIRRVPLTGPAHTMAQRRLSGGFLASSDELAAFAALPRDLAVPGLERARAKAVPAPIAVPTGGRGTKVLGDAQVGGHAVALSVPDSRFHTHMIGSTGSGKTTLLAGLALDDIKAGRGTVVIDPHGDMVLDILDRLPASAADRLVLIDPDQPNHAAFNPLQGEDPDLVTDNLVSIFGSIFAKAWGPRMDDVMRVACLTLLRHPAVTLQHIPPLLNSKQFRSEMTVDLDDPAGLGGFWAWYDELTPALRSQVIGPVLARLRSFLLRDFVAQTLRYPRSSFDMRKVLDGGILLVRLPKGALGEDTTKLLGSLILAQVWQAATARSRIPADRRRDASLIIDEAQNFLTLADSLDTMLAEARKYRLALTLAHQDLAQFPRELLAAASANARNKIYFACAPEDARLLARHTLPELDEHDLTHLDAYHAAARLIADGRQTPAFTLRTRPPRPLIGDTEEIRRRVAASVPDQDTSALDALVLKFSQRPRRDAPDRNRRPSAEASGTSS
ncbi:type IV secretion system DNA-binding domain-containing protein [Cryptosporangium phraense]|uniref:Type VI secretion protein n=1 Tax=Cryptosporangium phraense TaxID=2593070 RepID=A0A545ANA5_9ACTN|nr:type IV secretion system DNA-binding domain-containing protein [Cryptosporangium phraense]TQS42824.1 type VI secretion protein [Cryptosporangium phraense]